MWWIASIESLYFAHEKENLKAGFGISNSQTMWVIFSTCFYWIFFFFFIFQLQRPFAINVTTLTGRLTGNMDKI